jgi:hypothetical protein
VPLDRLSVTHDGTWQDNNNNNNNNNNQEQVSDGQMALTRSFEGMRTWRPRFYGEIFYVCMYVCVSCVCIYVCVCVCVCVSVYVCVSCVHACVCIICVCMCDWTAVFFF